jgi:alpha-glucuronidase
MTKLLSKSVSNIPLGTKRASQVTAVTQFLVMQHRDAVWFRDAGLSYFATFAKRPFANGYKPKYPLAFYKALPRNAAPPD